MVDIKFGHGEATKGLELRLCLTNFAGDGSLYLFFRFSLSPERCRKEETLQLVYTPEK